MSEKLEQPKTRHGIEAIRPDQDTFPARPHVFGQPGSTLAPEQARPRSLPQNRAAPVAVRDESSVSVQPARLTSSEIRRRLCHILPGLLPLLLWYFPHKDPLGPLLRNIIFTLIGGIGISIYLAQKYLTREGEKTWSHAVIGYTLTVLGTIVLFPAHIELGMTVLAILAFGDGMATLGGKLLQGPRIPWNPAKTWTGFSCFIACAGSMSSLIYWGEATPRVSWLVACTCGLITTFAAAIAESLPMKLNDNIRVGLVSAIAVVSVHSVCVGL